MLCIAVVSCAPDSKRSERARGLAKYLLESILNLGPTFIKVGGVSAARVCHEQMVALVRGGEGGWGPAGVVGE